MAKTQKQEERTLPGCMTMIRPVTDALDALSGKWKLPIIISVSLGPKRFTQVSNDIPGITDRMLSKELKELEMNQLIRRTVYDAFPPVVEYSITPHGRSLEKVIGALVSWGQLHRRKILGGK